jgi:hypothetical protein
VTVTLTHVNGAAHAVPPRLLRPDKVAELADAMRALLADPTAARADRRLSEAVDNCTEAEREAAWDLARPEEIQALRLPRPAVLQPPPGARLLPVMPLADPPEPAAMTEPAKPPSRRRATHRWPLLVIGGAAAVAIWSGWVALGAMCGFGLVEPLPGIVPWRVDTAITLPVSMEAYGAYALGVWLSATTPQRARKFAGKSAIGSLILGTSGQVIYHLLAAAHAAKAPWPVVVLVSCIPVAALAMAAALAHLLRDAGEPASDRDMADDDAPARAGKPPAQPDPEPVKPPAPPKPPVSRQPPRKPPSTTAKRPRATTKAAKADAAIAANPGKANAEIAKLAGVSERTVERQREAARKAAHP